jgi:rhodanese-related sulfurtransferase
MSASYNLEKAKEYFAQKVAFTTGPHELSGLIDADIVIVDVRFPTDYRKGHVPGAVNLPKGKWEKPEGLSKDKLNVLYCYSQQCHLAAEAAVQLLSQGYPVVELEGGFAQWEANSSPIEIAPPRAA